MSTATQEIKELKSQITDLEKSMKAHVKATGNGSTVHHVQEWAHNQGENLRGFMDTKRKQAVALRDDASSTIAKKPLQSTAIAFGAGVLLTALLRRS